MSTPFSDDLQALCDQAVAFSTRLSGPLARIAVRHGDTSVEVDWHEPAVTAAPSVSDSAATTTSGAASTPTGPSGPRLVRVGDTPEAGADGTDLHAVRAPLVGTFYRAPSPGAPPFVTVGSTVGAGDTIGIVEAMKLLNPITCDVAGRVVEVLPADGESVEFDQTLVRIDPHAAAGGTARVG